MIIILVLFIAITYGTICILYAILILTAARERKTAIKMHCQIFCRTFLVTSVRSFCLNSKREFYDFKDFFFQNLLSDKIHANTVPIIKYTIDDPNVASEFSMIILSKLTETA